MSSSLRLKDNLFMDVEKKQMASNASLIERLVNVSKAMERKIATPDEAKKSSNLTLSI